MAHTITSLAPAYIRGEDTRTPKFKGTGSSEVNKARYAKAKAKAKAKAIAFKAKAKAATKYRKKRNIKTM